MISMISFNMSAAEFWVVLAILALFVALLVLAAMLITATHVRNGMKAGYLKYAERATQAKIAEVEGNNRALKVELDRSRRFYEDNGKARRAIITDLETRLKAVDHLLTQGKLALTPGIDITKGVDK